MREKPFEKSFFSRSFPKPFIKKGFGNSFGFVLIEIKALRRLIGALFHCPYFSHSRKSFEDEKEDKVFVRAFFKKLAGVGQRPTLRLFFFYSFFLWPTHAKKKAGNGSMFVTEYATPSLPPGGRGTACGGRSPRKWQLST